PAPRSSRMHRSFVESPGLRPGLCRLRMTVALISNCIVGRDIPLVAFFAVLGKVQSLDLLFFVDPQANGYVHDLERHKGADNGERPGHSYSYELVGQLMGVAFEQARRQRVPLRIFEDWIDGAGREHASQDGAERAPGAVYAESVQGVIVAKAHLDGCDHVIADYAGD